MGGTNCVTGWIGSVKRNWDKTTWDHAVRAKELMFTLNDLIQILQDNIDTVLKQDNIIERSRLLEELFTWRQIYDHDEFIDRVIYILWFDDLKAQDLQILQKKLVLITYLLDLRSIKTISYAKRLEQKKWKFVCFKNEKTLINYWIGGLPNFTIEADEQSEYIVFRNGSFEQNISNTQNSFYIS